MSKTVCFSTLVCLGLASVLQGWGKSSALESQEQMPDAHFPLSPDQTWSLEESLLVWRPSEDGLDYAVRRSIETTATEQDEDFRLKHPHFKWGTGVRLKLTRYLSSDDPWDVNFLGTYFYSGADDEQKVNPATLGNGPFQEFLDSTWDTSLVGSAAKARATMQLNFFNFDWNIGRNYALTRKLDIHPFIGIRTLLLYQKYNARYFSTISAAPLAKTHAKSRHSFWGAGPQIGADLVMHVGKHWSFLGSLSGALFAGRASVKERFLGEQVIGGQTLPLKVPVKDKQALLRSNLDVFVGLGWEKWVRDGSVRIAPSFGFRVSEWFAVKRWIDVPAQTTVLASASVPTLQTHRRYSDLGLMGFDINLQVDF